MASIVADPTPRLLEGLTQTGAGNGYFREGLPLRQAHAGGGGGGVAHEVIRSAD
jgi:hypothetical protein